LTALPLSPLEGFVVSRIDGAADVATLCDLTSLEVEQVAQIVDRLIRLGAVEWAEETVSLPKATGRAPAKTPAGALTVPPNLRKPSAPSTVRPPSAPDIPKARVRLSGSRRVPTMPRQPYRGGGRSDHVESDRLSDLQTSPPRPSHTGSLRPPGRLVEVEAEDSNDAVAKADTLPPPSGPPPSGPPPSGPPPSGPRSSRAPSSARSSGRRLMSDWRPTPVPSDGPPDGGAPVHGASGTGSVASGSPASTTSTPPPGDPEPIHLDELASDVGIIDLGPFPGSPPVPEEAAASERGSDPPVDAFTGDPFEEEPVDPRSLAPEAPESPETTDGTGSAPPASEPAASAPPASEAPVSAAPASRPPASEVPQGDPTPSTAPSGSSQSPTAAASAFGATQPDAPAGDDAADLGADRRKEINDLYFALDLLDHYAVLSLPRTAEKAEIRKRYFAISKRFHPDTMFRKRLGSFKPRMEAIFHRATEAYEVLSRKKRRLEYDAYLERVEKTRAAEVEVEVGETEARQVERRTMEPPIPVGDVQGVLAGASEAPSSVDEAAASVPPSGAFSGDPPASKAPPLRTLSDAERRARQRMLARRLLGGRSPSSSRPPGDSGRPGQEGAARRLASTLIGAGEITGSRDRSRRQFDMALRSEREGDLAMAVRQMRLAKAMAPEEAEIAAELDRLAFALAASLAEEYEKQAMYEQSNGKWAAAATSWGKVSEGRPKDAAAAHNAAEALLRARGDLHRAEALIKKAIDLEPDDLSHQITLAKVYVGAGLGLGAKRVLRGVLKAEPKQAEAKQLLESLD
jgi:curved DNA-binding protein CbpA